MSGSKPLSTSPATRDLIAQAWVHRFSARIPETRGCVEELEKQEQLSPFEQSELELLRVSLVRHEMKLELAKAHLDKAAAWLKEAGLRGSFQYYMQASLNLSAESKFAESFRARQEAVKWATTDFELLIAKFNLAISQFNLNLPNKQTLEEIEVLLKRNPDHPLKAGFEQLRVMDLKQWFFQGRFREVLAIRFEKLNQGLYKQAWLATLPWGLDSDSGPKQNFVARSWSEEEFFQKQYRLQTLLADPRLLGLQDEDNTLQLKIDRLFLWTWLWLANPESGLSSMIKSELEAFPFAEAHLSLTSEDFLLLESLGGWLSLFDAVFARNFQHWLSAYSPANPQASTFFELDRRCRAVFDANGEILAEIEEIEKNADDAGDDLQGYFACVKAIANSQPKESAQASNGVTVRLDESSLVAPGKRVLSQPGAELLAALKRNDSLPFSAALEIAFGIPGYDEFVHAPKINNLIQRLKSLLPETVVLRTKNQRVYLEDPKGEINVVAGSPHRRHFPTFEFPIANLEKKQVVQKEKRQDLEFHSRLLMAFEYKTQFSRQDLEEALGISKATANRLISHWLMTGVLEKVGAGRSVDYRILRP